MATLASSLSLSLSFTVGSNAQTRGNRETQLLLEGAQGSRSDASGMTCSSCPLCARSLCFRATFASSVFLSRSSTRVCCWTVRVLLGCVTHGSRAAGIAVWVRVRERCLGCSLLLRSHVSPALSASDNSLDTLRGDLHRLRLHCQFYRY